MPKLEKLYPSTSTQKVYSGLEKDKEKILSQL